MARFRRGEGLDEPFVPYAESDGLRFSLLAVVERELTCGVLRDFPVGRTVNKYSQIPQVSDSLGFSTTALLFATAGLNLDLVAVLSGVFD